MLYKQNNFPLSNLSSFSFSASIQFIKEILTTLTSIQIIHIVNPWKRPLRATTNDTLEQLCLKYNFFLYLVSILMELIKCNQINIIWLKFTIHLTNSYFLMNYRWHSDIKRNSLPGNYSVFSVLSLIWLHMTRKTDRSTMLIILETQANNWLKEYKRKYL